MTVTVRVTAVRLAGCQCAVPRRAGPAGSPGRDSVSLCQAAESQRFKFDRDEVAVTVRVTVTVCQVPGHKKPEVFGTARKSIRDGGDAPRSAGFR